MEYIEIRGFFQEAASDAYHIYLAGRFEHKSKIRRYVKNNLLNF